MYRDDQEALMAENKALRSEIDQLKRPKKKWSRPPIPPSLPKESPKAVLTVLGSILVAIVLVTCTAGTISSCIQGYEESRHICMEHLEDKYDEWEIADVGSYGSGHYDCDYYYRFRTSEYDVPNKGKKWKKGYLIITSRDRKTWCFNNQKQQEGENAKR